MILFIAGTRPELIKLHPVYWAIRTQLRESMDSITAVKLLCVAQQKDLVAQHADRFDGRDVEHLPLGEAVDGRTADGLDTLYPRLIGALEQWFSEYRGGLVNRGHGHVTVVQGDTLTAAAGALVAKAHGWTVLHVEAGLRSPRMDMPYPEEWARRFISTVADIHCAPTVQAERNLHAERVHGLILRTGNTGVDALRYEVGRLRPRVLWKRPVKILITCHRREAWDRILPSLVSSVVEMAHVHPTWTFVWPLHPNPLIAKLTEPLGVYANVMRTRALSRNEFVQEMVQAAVIVTDSGGVIEDAVTLGRPVCIIRDVTERPEALDVERSILVPGDSVVHLPSVVEQILKLGDGPASTVFGDGGASERIANLLLGMRPCHA